MIHQLPVFHLTTFLLTGMAFFVGLVSFHDLRNIYSRSTASHALYGDRPPAYTPCGLRNVWLSCYANTLFQCLRHIDVLQEFLSSVEVDNVLRGITSHSPPRNFWMESIEAVTNLNAFESDDNRRRRDLGRFLSLFNELVNDLQTKEHGQHSRWSTSSSVDTRPIMRALAAAAPQSFPPGVQHDPHELFMFFHDAVESVLPEQYRQSWLDLFMIRQGTSSSNALILHFPDPAPYHIQLMDLIKEALGSGVVEQDPAEGNSCMDGDRDRRTTDDQVSVDDDAHEDSHCSDVCCDGDDNDIEQGSDMIVSDSDPESDCLSEATFATASSLFDSDYESATESPPWRIQLPPVLTLLISRSGYQHYAYRIDTSVFIPEVLDLCEIVDQPDAIYHLTAICNHSSKYHDSGHYYAVAKTDHGWAYFDDGDSGLMPSFPAYQVADQAYLVFYTRTNQNQV